MWTYWSGPTSAWSTICTGGGRSFCLFRLWSIRDKEAAVPKTETRAGELHVSRAAWTNPFSVRGDGATFISHFTGSSLLL